MQEFVIGETYAFEKASLFREYGEWTVSRIEDNKIFAYIERMGREVLMAHQHSENFHPENRYRIKHIERFEPVVEEDWS
jgi:hypothetical protein